MGLDESVLEEDSIRESRQWIVQCLVGELFREGAFLGDLALGGDEVDGLAGGVARGRARDFRDNQSTVFSDVALDIAELLGLVRVEARNGVFGDADVWRVGEMDRVEPYELLLCVAHHSTKG